MIIRIRNFSILLTIVFLVILIDQSFKINAKTKLLNNTFFLSNNLMFVYYDPPNLGEKILSLYELVKIYFFMPLFLVGLIFFYIKKVRRKNKILLFCLPLVIGGGFSIFLDYFFIEKK